MLHEAIAILRCQHHHHHGTILLKEIIPGGLVEIDVNIKGLSPGLHGFHIHRRGNELEGSSSLCDHYNPTNQNHGGLNELESHVGDLGNLLSIETEEEELQVNDRIIANRVRLRGPYSVIGRSLVVHSDPDDLGKGGFADSLTTGHSGSRILWGIIGINDGENCL